MKVLVQWAQRDPQDWIEIDAANWLSLPKRDVPAGGGRQGGKDNQLGWICGLNVQGVQFNGYDHMAVEPVAIGIEEGVRVTCWNDDPEDWPVGERQARIWTFLNLAPDPSLGNAINTRQSQLVYAEGARFQQLEANVPQNTALRPWSEFVQPPAVLVRHGVWMEDSKYAEHVNTRWMAGWRNWVDHLPESETEIVGGRRVLKAQRDQGRYRVPSHTITYYQRSDNRAVNTVTVDHENALETTAGPSDTESITLHSDAGRFIWTAPANQPNVADWPSGTYHAQFDCTAASTGVVYGHDGFVATVYAFQKISGNLTTVVANIASAGGVREFSGTGLKLMSSSTWDPASGSASDVYAVVCGALGDSHGDVITLRYSSDAYADGPWSVEPEVPEQKFWFRTMHVPGMRYPLRGLHIGRSWFRKLSWQ